MIFYDLYYNHIILSKRNIREREERIARHFNFKVLMSGKILITYVCVKQNTLDIKKTVLL